MTNDELEAVRPLTVRECRRRDRAELAAWKARATRAEAHAALLQTEATYWHDKHNQDRLALAASEAHAERSDELISRIEGQAVCVAISGPDEWGDMLLNIAQWITAWRMEQHPKNASAYRGVKDEACSRPSDALDAPVQPTSSHLGNGADQ